MWPFSLYDWHGRWYYQLYNQYHDSVITLLGYNTVVMHCLCASMLYNVHKMQEESKVTRRKESRRLT